MFIKIGRHEYEITENDRFMDNEACIQLLTQSSETSSWGRRPNPVMSKKLASEFLKKDLVEYESGEGIRILGIKGE